MPSWNALLHLGDLRVTVPLALGIAAWLLGMRAQRAALLWSLLFGLGLCLVGASKIAYLGWGGGWPALGFKSISGHATGASAVLPLLLFLATRRGAGLVLGVALGALVAVLLVALGEHSTSEALAGWLLGSGISLAAAHRAAPLQDRARPALPAAALAALACVSAAGLMQYAHVGYWMIRAARQLSGNTDLYPLTLD